MAGFGLLLIACLLGASANAVPSENAWALLVASTGVSPICQLCSWANYGLQADALHAYHTVLAAGIPADRIIVMMPDDIANNPTNPSPGKVFNRPNGKDVYAGVKIDYRGNDVTPDNFLNILSGNKAAMAGKGTGRVIESDEKSNLFVYLVDHGANQLVAFDDLYLTANNLHLTITSMHSHKKYKQMVFYLDACHSGSMFDGMYPPEMKVFAMTATRPDENGYFCFCKDQELNGACLATEFSTGWTVFWDAQSKGSSVSFTETYEFTKNFTSKWQHASIFGDLSLGKEELEPNVIGVTPTPEISSCPVNIPKQAAHYQYLVWQLRHAKDQESYERAQLELNSYLEEEKEIEELKSELLNLFASESKDILEYQENGVILPTTRESRECYEDIVDHFSEKCIHPLRIQNTLVMFANACVMDLDIPTLKDGITATCQQHECLISNKYNNQ
ncbi:hypothetical protein GE061_000731 [Apolygus lucorum]|uniref:Legumain n=1 Tax=Apolygus lucorum TaxID=248454 RepID=A0A8S9Y6N8_APOLU|nr:hypothetical protein GE061_000731 [Apolygus lucorum]